MPAAQKERPAVLPKKNNEFQHFLDEWEQKLHRQEHAEQPVGKKDVPTNPKKAA